MSKNFFNEISNKKLTTCWEKIPWNQKKIFLIRIQQNIYSYSLQGNIPQILYHQKIILISLNTKLLAIRQVLNHSSIKLTSGNKIRLALSLNINSLSNLYNYWEKLKFNISYSLFKYIYTQSISYLIYWSLEAQWEAYLEPGVFGFRSQYIAQDASCNLFTQIQKQKFKYIIYVKLAIHFQHSKLLKQKLHNSDLLNNLIHFYIENSKDNRSIKIALINNNIQLEQLFITILTYGIQYSLISNQLLLSLDQKNTLNSIYYFSYKEFFCILCHNPISCHRYYQVLSHTLKVLKLKPLYYTYSMTSKFNFLHFLFDIKENHLNISPNINSKKKLIRHIRQILYKKDFLGRNRAMTHITLNAAILRINPLIRRWFNNHLLCNKIDDFKSMDEIINNTIYRWQIKKYKKNIVQNWKQECIRYIKRRRRIAHGKTVLDLLFLRYINKKTFFPRLPFRSFYEQDKNYWK
uniref:putative reverse transcriptase/maturase n=1 Tax=Rhodaphanes brevistipitata TaxID=446136 RepID=UPI001FCD2AAB|nr:putative reverse transcriptase/maturase [Rhodaphanes brevistipitata]UNJ18397.1 putative reverse transcriptase/maturase [Rhodaphanes brevistipitata]